MIGLLKRNRGGIPIAGDLLFTTLVFPFTFTFLERWVAGVDTTLWLSAAYASLALSRLFRAFRLRGQSRPSFFVYLACAAILGGCAGMAAFKGSPDGTHTLRALGFWICMLAERVLSIVRQRKPWNIAFNIILILLFLVFTINSSELYSAILVTSVATLSSLASIMVFAFSRIRLDILRDIVRKTYAVEIISGLLMLMVASSYMLRFTDDAFPSFWDGLWYCFAVVTTIGFGDLTPTTAVGRKTASSSGSTASSWSR